jgi:hypothetical protein
MTITNRRELEASIDMFLDAAQGRLSSAISRNAVLESVRRAARFEGAIAFTQPGHSGYAWSRRKVALALACRLEDTIYVRVRCGTSARNNELTPGIWPELRGYPKGNLREKFKKWAESDDVIRVDAALIKSFGLEPYSTDVTEGCISDAVERRYASAEHFSGMQSEEKKISIRGGYRPHIIAGLSDATFEIRQLSRSSFNEPNPIVWFLQRANDSDGAERKALLEDANTPLDANDAHVLDQWLRLDTKVRTAILRHRLLAGVAPLALTRDLANLLDEQAGEPSRSLTESEVRRLLGFGYLPWIERVLHRTELPVHVALHIIQTFRPTGKVGGIRNFQPDAVERERTLLSSFASRRDLRAIDIEALADRARNLTPAHLIKLLAHRECSAVAAEMIAKVEPELVLRHCALPIASVIEIVSGHTEKLRPSVVEELVAHPACSSVVLERIATTHPEIALRHKGLAHEIVVRLSGSADARVRAAAAAHSNLPPERWELLLRAGCSADLSSVVEQRVLAPEDVSALWETGFPWDLRLALAQPYNSDQWIERFFWCVDSSPTGATPEARRRTAIQEFLSALENPSLSRFAFDVLFERIARWLAEQSHRHGDDGDITEQPVPPERAERALIREKLERHPAWRPHRTLSLALRETAGEERTLGFLSRCPEDNPSIAGERTIDDEHVYGWRLYNVRRESLGTFRGNLMEASHELTAALKLRLKRKSLKASGLEIEYAAAVFIGRNSV